MNRSELEAGSLDPADLLRAELGAVEPSAAFAAGVRARVSARHSAATIWTMRAAVAAAAVMVAGAAAVRWAGPSVPTRETAAPIAAVRSHAAPASPEAVASVHRPGPAARPERQRPPAVRVAERRLEVLVPPDQAIAVRRVLAAYAAGLRVTMASNGGTFDEGISELQEPAPIQIAPVRIERLGMVDFVEFFWGGIRK
jgi:hypothetical protein